MPERPRRRPAVAGSGRAVLLASGAAALLLGLDAAAMLLDLPAPLRLDRLPQVHGILLVLGFVGTLVALERAVALGRWWGFAAPSGLGLGGLLLVAPVPERTGGWPMAAGAAALVAVYAVLWRRQRVLAVVVQAGGSVLALGAVVLWAGGVPVPVLLPWLAGFLVLTVAGERLELARVTVLAPAAEPAAVGAAAGVAVGAAVALLWPALGYPLLGASLLGLTGWLVRFDVARRTVRSSGLPRFMACCLLAGYAWLAVAGALWLLVGPLLGGRGYDAVVHAVFLGFVVSMLMAHAPVILPAVLRRPLPYTAWMYLPAALLHASLLLRVVVGDLRGVEPAWRAGGALNIVAVLGFVAVAAGSGARGAVGARRDRPAPQRPAGRPRPTAVAS